jgi:hypothetical protein
MLFPLSPYTFIQLGVQLNGVVTNEGLRGLQVHAMLLNVNLVETVVEFSLFPFVDALLSGGRYSAEH